MNTPATPRKEPGLASVHRRALALFVFLVLLPLWYNHHFDGRLATFLAYAGPAIASAFAVLSQLFGEKELRDFRRWLVAPVAWLMDRRVLVLLYTGAAILILNLSSISLGPFEGGAHPDVVLIDPASGKEIGSGTARGDESLRFHVFPGPLGKQYRIKAAGFAPLEVTVRSPLMTRVLQQDLEEVPSVHFRPTPNGVWQLQQEGSSFLVYRITEEGDSLLCEVQGGTGESFLVGRARQVPADFPFWRMELTALQSNPADTDNTLLAWARPRHLGLDPPLELGWNIGAEVLSRDSTVVSVASVIVTRGKVIDVRMYDP